MRSVSVPPPATRPQMGDLYRPFRLNCPELWRGVAWPILQACWYRALFCLHHHNPRHVNHLHLPPHRVWLPCTLVSCPVPKLNNTNSKCIVMWTLWCFHSKNQPSVSRNTWRLNKVRFWRRWLTNRYSIKARPTWEGEFYYCVLLNNKVANTKVRILIIIH